ncbi:MAG: hypothetical protein JWR74_2892 [Polaromonas sp.]|nr:hypothetical protein [Polaromonas sp.]
MGSCLNMNAFVHMAGLAAVRAAQAGWAQTGNDATGTIVTASCGTRHPHDSGTDA